MSRNTLRYLASSVAVVALTSLWVVFGPSQLGGSVTYVTTHGDSMEPKMKQGDLALVRSSDSYEVGDDCVLGGDGNDSLGGGQGKDVCIGGPGFDTFHNSCETPIQ